MRNRLIKKYSVMFVMRVYALSTFLQSFSFLDFNKVYAQESQLDLTNLVAIFVDDKIYSSLENDIERYAKKYIQWSDSNTRYNAISNSKAIVLPVNIENITAPEITKILENMYFDGISGEPSKLAGVILIWEIPLPVVNQNWFVYPTIYPYVDFEEQKFIWDDDIKYFVYNDSPKWQPEIWHGLINFDKVNEYKDYFNKLKKYAEDPSNFIWKNIWYDDIVANKQYFYSEALWSYINNFLFAEDIWYKRYSDLMIKIMQGSHNDMISGLLEWFSGANELMSVTETMSTPTMSIERIIKDGYLKSYTSLIWWKQLDRTVKNVETANRWVEQFTWSDGSWASRTSLDTHYLKMEQKDETVLRMDWWIDPLIILFNEALENIVDEKIEKEKYWLNDVIPVTYLKYDWFEKFSNINPTCTWKEYSAYENYFFGISAKNIDEMQQTSSYRWTFRNLNNISWLTISDIQSWTIPSLDLNTVDLNKKSIWWSYDIFATQVDANRWYNISKTVQELEIYKNNKIAKREYWNTKCDKRFLGICWRKRRREADTAPEEHLCNANNEEQQWGCEMPQEFAIRNRWWASPLNLSGMNWWLSGYRFQDAVMPVFDIAWSKAINQSEKEANSFEWINKYSRLIQQKFVPSQQKYYNKNKEENAPDLFGLWYNSSMGEDMKFTNRLPIWNMDNPSWIYVNPIQASTVNFFNKFDASASWEWDIIKIKKQYDNECVGNWEIFTYRTLDSRVKNDLSTNIELKWTNYKVFNDNTSPSKRFYESLIDKLDRLDDGVQRRIDDLNLVNTWWATYNLKQLWNYVDWIQNKISSINNFSLSSLQNMNATQIQQLANQWSVAFTQQDYINVKNNSEKIKNQLLDLDGFVDTFGYDYIYEYMDEQFYNFKINDRKLIFLNTRKTNLFTKVLNTNNKFNSIKPLVINAKNEYDDIDRLSITLSSMLWTKRLAINAHIQNNSWVSLWCNSTYASLCNAIDTVRDNLSNYRSDMNNEIDKITSFSFQDFDFDGSSIWALINSFNPFGSIQNKIPNSNVTNSYTTTYQKLQMIPTSTNTWLTAQIPWMNLTTSDRPIDSPKYITFKWIGWDKVTFIYPNLYKSEVFSGNNNILKLKTPEEISSAIKKYLIETVKKYNEYLISQNQKKSIFYNQNSQAYNKLSQWDPLASPIASNAIRPYNLIPENYLIEKLENKLKNNIFFKDQMWGYEPIDFIAHLIHYQNIWRWQRQLWTTIQEDINNTISDFDVNEKITHIVDNYLIKDNNKWNYITPAYREKWYEVAFINSDGSDYISAKAEPAFAQNIRSAANNFSKQSTPQIENNQLAEELKNECNIPEAEWVLIFDISDMSSPWMNALKCRWEKIKQKPFEFSFDWSISQWPVFNLWKEWDSIWNIVSNNLGLDNIQSQYMNQLWYLDNDNSNQEVLDNSNPGDYQKLEKIVSYTKIETLKQNINADVASGVINISSSIELGDVEFYIKNVWSSLVSISDGNTSISNNITEWSTGYMTWKIIFDPFSKKEIAFDINNPIAENNVIVFYMCLPGTQNIWNCVKKSLKLSIIPGKIKNIAIETQWNSALQWSKFPIIVKWIDNFWNNVGQLFTDKFEISVSTWKISYQSTISEKITFSDFNKSHFVLNIDEKTPNNTQIRINVDWNIEWAKWTYASKDIIVKRWQIKAYKWNNAISNLTIDLPSTNDYSYKDSFNLTQINLNTTPHIEIKLQDTEWNLVNIESYVNVASKNWLMKPGEIEERSVTKSQNNMSFEVNQKRFSQKNNFTIKNGNLIVYFMPNFKAWDDIISISIPWIEALNIPVKINPAPASTVEITTKKDSISTSSDLPANLKISDNWWNIVTKNTNIKLWVLWPINISGTNNTSIIVNVKSGYLDFGIKSKEKWWNGFVYATIEWLSLWEQKPGNKNITVQEKILPEKDLNIMYLNLFGNDWGNQWWFMSDNKKYIQKLINNSDKLITSTTQLISPENVRKFPTILSKNLKFINIENNEIEFLLDDELKFDIKEIGEIGVNINSLNFQWVGVSEENLENVIEKLIENKYSNKNVLIYIPESTDSIIESNETKNSSIFINNEKVFDLSAKTQNQYLKINLSENSMAWYQIWEAKLNNKKIWSFLFVINKISEINLSAKSNSLEYDYNTIRIDWSTNKEWIWFYQIWSEFPKNTLWYKSIQDSKDPTLWIWFTNNFKNITDFGAGKSVWESTINFASEFLINIWDPLLRRIDENVSAKMWDNDLNIEIDSGFDKWIWEVVYSEPNKTILKVINIDFNNDWLEDIIVAFTDGSIKILKNYGWNNPFKNLWDLMILADGIKEIIVWDVDGNWYDDIIIRNNADVLRVYKNTLGVFDVDGLPICINTNVKDGIKTDTPQKVNGVNQIFFEDMNNDGALDIITNDKLWYIKIFYGGKTSGKDNYVSTEKNVCDDNRYDRQNVSNNTKTVYRFGIRINENIKVLDKSLIRWKWINPDEDININMADLWINTSAFNNISEDNIESVLWEAMNFDINSAVQQYKWAERYKLANFKIIPLYENEEDENKIEYVEIWCLTWSDPVKIYKKYEDINWDVLENGDKVQVSITIKANQNFIWTFIDNIMWPWIIPLTWDMDMIENFWFEPWTISTGQVENELKFHRNMINSRYMIDNLSMKAGDEIKINYRVFYDGDVQTSTIDIKDVNGSDYEKFGGNNGETLDNYSLDWLMDIKISPTDGCNKSMFVLFNNNQWNKKNYNPEYIDLAKILANFSNTNQSNLENAMSSITNSLANNSSGQEPNFDNIPWLSNIFEWSNITDVWSSTFDWNNIVSQWWIDLNNILNIPAGIIDGLMWDVMKKVDKLMWDMCKWFDLSEYGIWWNWNCGLPIPFNQAFLWPGEYHLFGCFTKPLLPLTNTIWKWLPVLTIPGNWPSPAWYLPIPWVFWLPFKGPTDWFLWVPWWSRDSQFRLYVVPTLTAEIWIAMCFGPYKVWAAIPDPASSIWWNCIVTAIPLPCKDEWSSLWPNSTNIIPEAFLDMNVCTNQNIPCYVWQWESSSSLELVSSSSNSANLTLAIPDGSFAGWFINIEKTPITQQWYKTPESGIEINGVKLSGGANSQNKILWWQAKWFIQELTKNFIDKQINYIFSNLTNFKVDVAWPDFEWIVSWVPELFDDWKAMTQCAIKNGIWNENDKTCELSDKQKCENKWMERVAATKICKEKANPSQNEEELSKLDAWSKNNLVSRSQVSNLSETFLANPLEFMETLSEDIPLINLRTENITVKVPMISTEDITAYVSMSKNWIAQQEKVLQEWFDLFKALVWRCGWDEDIKNWSDLKNSITKLKKELKSQLDDEIKWVENKLQEIEKKISETLDPEEKKRLEEEKNKTQNQKNSLNQDLDNIKNQISQIKNLNKKYDFNDFGNYEIFESCTLWEYFIKPELQSNTEWILPYDIYILYKPWSNKELSMFTQWFDLIETKQKNKTKISFKRNWQVISNKDICIKNKTSSSSNQCVEMFLWWKLDMTLNNFLNIQSNTTQLITSVKQNIDTLELYKKFPIDLYEWMHVWERYMSEIGSLINNFLGTLSLRMKTNATRYSQYVDSIILIITTLQTYQAIIDLSKNRSERCGTCTNDNYDQFACKLSMLCPKESLPIFEIPPFKIPSIFIDFSNINLGMDVKLPKFNFVPTSVPLPSLPNIPKPPSFDAFLDMEQALSMWVDLVWDMMIKLELLNVSISLPAMPIIPSPPDLPELPSFIPNVKLELPLLPPAPKIPKLPNEIKAAIDTAETIWKILCIVKWNIGLVWEESIKAKIEQMTQRTYEVPYRDNMDQTLSDWNNTSKNKIPEWVTNIFGFLKANEFQNVELKWFDIWIESIVNVQYSFDWVYDFINSIVASVNKYSSMPWDWMQEQVNESDKISRDLEKRMSACTRNPASEDCLGNLYDWVIKETKEKLDKMSAEIKSIGDNIKNGFTGVKEAIQLIAKYENEKNELEEKLFLIEKNIILMEDKINDLK